MAKRQVSSRLVKKANNAPPSSSSNSGGTYEKMVRFHELISEGDPGIKGSSLGINEAKTSVVKAVLGGQYDVQALSTFSGLPVPEVIAILQEMKGFGRSFNEVSR